MTRYPRSACTIRLKPRSYLLIIVVVLLFSTVFVFSKQVIPPLDAFSYLFLRSSLGAIFLVFMLQKAHLFGELKHIMKARKKDIFMFSITFHLVPLIFVFIATPLTNPTNQVIINNMNLTFVILINLLLYKVRPSRNMGLAVLLNFAGCLLVLWPLDFSQNPNLAGDIIMIVAVLIGAFFPIWNKRLAGSVDPLVIGFSLNAFPALAMTPVLFFPAQVQAIASLDVLGWIYVGFIGIGISGIAYVLGSMAYKDPACTPEVYSTWCTLIPVFGMVISLFLYGYIIGVINLIGAAIVIASIYLAQARNELQSEKIKDTPSQADSRESN